MRQTTLSHSVSCTGIGIHSACEVRMTLAPAAAGSGILFRRTDVSSDLRARGLDVIAARYDNVVDTRLGTTIANSAGVSVATVEHLMAALYGIGIDNAEIRLDGPEVPVMDGSAAPFVFLIECAGIRSLAEPRLAIKICEPVSVEEGDRRVSLLPCAEFVVDLEIDFSSQAVRRQSFGLTVNEASFKTSLARARTFGFRHEVEHLHGKGLALGGSLDNCVVLDGDIVMNEEGLRFPNEFVRHKVIDVIGDLALAGAPLFGRFIGTRSGHGMNNALLRALFAEPKAFALVRLETEAQAVSLPRRVAGRARVAAASA